MASPARGELWLIDFNPTVGREQAGMKPALIISDDRFNLGPSGLVVVLAVTSQDRGYPAHIRIDPKETGLKKTSFIMADQIRTVSKNRLIRLVGSVTPEIITEAEKAVRRLLAL